MITTKLFIGTGIVFLSFLAFEKQIQSHSYISIDNKASKHSSSQPPGKEIYTDFCMQCHGANGKGSGKRIPPLDGSDWLSKKRSESIAAVKYGQRGEITVNEIKYKNAMPSMDLTDQEVADVMNYVMSSWSNKQTKIVTAKEVASLKK
jgi:mono/diheme cytochrome c family protein